MKSIFFAALTALSVCLGPAATARAQFTLALPPRARIETGAGSSRTTSILLYPVAPFAINDALGVQTFSGGLISIEHAVVPDTRRSRAYALGGWYWTDFARDLYELHGKVYFKGDLGAQVGVVGSTRVGGLSYDAFLIYNLTPAYTDRNYWNFQVGAGLFMDPNVRSVGDPFAGKKTLADFTGFLQGDTSLRENLKLTVSYWYVNTGGRFNRFAIGVGWAL